MANPLMQLWSLTGLSRRHIAGFGVPMIGFTIGGYLDYQDTLRMTKFRDKSALYYRELKEGEKPTWPSTYVN